MSTIINMFRGFCMALADSVPGVSGGTIAFLLGFYDLFINSLNDLMHGSKEERIKALKFLIKLGIGWIIGFGLAVSFLASFFENGIYKASSLFLGFIIFAIPVMAIEEKECLKGKYYNLIFMLLGIIIVVAVSSLNFGVNVDPSNLTIGTILYIFIAGMLAISAMVLPGISGSTILFAFGLYLPVITGIKGLMHFDFSSVWLLVIIVLGIITGVFVTLKGIKKLLNSYRSATIYTVIGMMLGSLYAIVIGPRTLDIPKDALSASTFNPWFFILGGIVLLLIQLFKNYIEKKNLD